MSIEIKVPFPKYEGMEVKKVTADIEKGYSVVEYGEKEPEFKKGDIIKSGDMYKDRCIYIFSHISTSGRRVPIVGITAHGDLKIYEKNTTYFYGSKPERHANAEERQILFDALAKDGKKWNDDTKEVEPIEKDILVPDSIGIYRYNGYSKDNDGDRLYISFNENRQLLYYCDGHYNVVTFYEESYTKVQCKLTPCKREELKEGDTGFCCHENKDFGDIMNYMKVLKDGAIDFVWIDDETNIYLCTEFNDTDYSFFKVEPIQ